MLKVLGLRDISSLFFILSFLFTFSSYANNYGIPGRVSPSPTKNTEEFVRKRSNLNYMYFSQFITSFPKVGISEFYNYVDPLSSLPHNPGITIFQKIAALRYLNKTAAQLTAMKKINQFLSTNFKTTYLPGEVYFDNNHIAKPLYIGQLKNLMFQAISRNDIDAVRAILDNFNLLHIKNKNGYTLMSYAILHQKNDIAEILLYRGTYINEPNDLGETPLIIAVRSNNFPMIRFLLKNGADPNLKDKFNKTPIDYAICSKNNEVIELLNNYLHIYNLKKKII